MSARYSRAIDLFVIGILVLGVGIFLSTYTRTETRYQNVYGFQIPTQVTVQPYLTLGAVMVAMGVIVIVVGLIQTGMVMRVSPPSTSSAPSPTPSPQQLSELNRPAMTEETTLIHCEKCGTMFPLTYNFCPNCGAKRGNST